MTIVCPGCEGAPAPENDPCAVCGRSRMTTPPTAPQDGGEKLAPCPFCGGVEVSIARPYGAHQAACENCCAGSAILRDDETAIAAWNARATPDLAAVRNEALEEAAADAPQDGGEKLARALVRPIAGIENRTAQEVFDIMVARILRALQQKGPSNG